MLEHGIRVSRRGALLARLGIVSASLRMLLAGNRLLPKLAARIYSGADGSGFTSRVAGEIRKLPPELWPVVAWHWSQAKNFDGMVRHLECLPESAAEMVGSRLDPALPVTELVAGNTPDPKIHENWRVIRAAGSGHWIQLDRPDLVIQAVQDMLGVKP